jgi:predicted glycosyltransferase
MDYEHQPANHVAFRLASVVIVPESFPAPMLKKYGAASEKVRKYQGIKEDVYLANFQPDPAFQQSLRDLGISPDEVMVLVRPPARDALYHRFENDLFDDLMASLATRPGVRVVFLPRTEVQRKHYTEKAYANFIFPTRVLDGSNLINSADLVVSAGGTMNREAAALGVPAATIYAGEWAAIDELLVREGRLLRIGRREDFVIPERKQPNAESTRRMTGVKEQVVDLILGAGKG